jgi:hypothetical protein
MYFLRLEHVNSVKCLLEKKLLSFPLKPIIANGPFQQWGLEFIGEIHPPSSGKHRWILTTTDYLQNGLRPSLP